METIELIALPVIGLLAGLIGGLLGVGGSIIMIPAMTEVLGPDQHLYQAAAMVVNFFVVVPAVYQHHRAQAVDSALVARVIPFAIVTVLAGVVVSELPLFAREGEAYLRGLFGLLLMCVAGTDLYRLIRRAGIRASNPDEAVGDRIEKRHVQWRAAAAVGIPMGFVAGLLGVGGGILAVPLQRRFLGVPIRSAIANSATLIIATSFIGAVAKNGAFAAEHAHGSEPLILAMMLIPTAIVGSLIGGRLTHRAPLKFVKAAFFLLLVLAALRLTRGAVRALLPPTAARATVSVKFRDAAEPLGSRTERAGSGIGGYARWIDRQPQELVFRSVRAEPVILLTPNHESDALVAFDGRFVAWKHNQRCTASEQPVERPLQQGADEGLAGTPPTLIRPHDYVPQPDVVGLGAHGI